MLKLQSDANLAEDAVQIDVRRAVCVSFPGDRWHFDRTQALQYREKINKYLNKMSERKPMDTYVNLGPHVHLVDQRQLAGAADRARLHKLLQNLAVWIRRWVDADCHRQFEIRDGIVARQVLVLEGASGHRLAGQIFELAVHRPRRQVDVVHVGILDGHGDLPHDFR